MNGWTLAAALLLTALVGAWLALVVRALIADAALRRIGRATVAALQEDDLLRLRESIAKIDEHERARVG